VMKTFIGLRDVLLDTKEDISFVRNYPAELL
jgi:hypothetical protein